MSLKKCDQRQVFKATFLFHLLLLPLSILILCYSFKEFASRREIVVTVTFFTFENKLMEASSVSSSAGQLTAGELPWSQFQAVFSHTY